MRSWHNKFRATLAVAAMAAMGGGASAADSLAVVAPVARPGPYPVACSNIAQDFSRLMRLETADQYWRGLSRSDGSPRYVTDLLSEPEGALSYSYGAPADTELFGGEMTPERHQRLVDQTLVGRAGAPADVAALVEFLVSADAGHVTAQVVQVNGGALPR